MSESAGKRVDATERQALARLEAGVGRLLADRGELTKRVEQAEARVQDLEALLKRFTKGDANPAALQATISLLESENEVMREKIREGREGVDRLLARIRFIEDLR
jgi:predicted RNase H-like nuclease (RuvC/YqgF family)